MLWMGVDGGGSTLRVGVYDDELIPVAEITRQQIANPSVIGHEAAADLLRLTLRDLLRGTPGGVQAVRGVGVGIAGADATHSRAWLEAVLSPLLPGVHIAASSDYETAMIGALGARYGVLLLAGTGSVAYAVNQAGEDARVGGWGYVLEDVGSGHWLGVEALRAAARHIDDHTDETPLLRGLHGQGVPLSRDGLIAWVYRDRKTDEIARLAPVVLEAAETDPAAQAIIDRAVGHLVGWHVSLLRLLHMTHDDPPVAFAGGLLASENVLSRRLAAALGLPAIPRARYTALEGAALLAKLQVSSQTGP